MGSALMSEASDLTLADYPEFADIFSIGGTKNGALFGEALVFSNVQLADEFIYYQKQQSLLLAKGFLLGAQFEALFEEDLYFRIAQQANDMAKKLYEGLDGIGYTPIYPMESNQLFVEVEREKVEPLQKAGQFEIAGEGEKTLVRFVTTYETKDEEIEELLSVLQK